jgi:hypothetical protein
MSNAAAAEWPETSLDGGSILHGEGDRREQRFSESGQAFEQPNRPPGLKADPYSPLGRFVPSDLDAGNFQRREPGRLVLDPEIVGGRAESSVRMSLREKIYFGIAAWLALWITGWYYGVGVADRLTQLMGW